MSQDIRDAVQEKYAAAARKAAAGEKGSCGPSGSCGCDPVTENLYDISQTTALPEGAVLASLGCGNPTALADLHAGETVLDLGSGGGIDVLLSAKRVGPTGKAYGLDMTDEMLALARANQAKAGVTNVEFLKGEIENIPLPAGAVDVIISNCVINLSADKGRVLKEAFRVLRPDGRFAVSDVVCRGEIPDAVRRSMELWVGCIAGALDEHEYRQLLNDAGFVDVDIEPTRIYQFEDAGLGETLAREISGRVMGAFIRARKMLLPSKENGHIDLGQVGEIDSIDPSVIQALEAGGFIPVVAPIGTGSDGTTYNINADLVAGKLAEVLRAEKLVVLTNTPGVLDKAGKLLTGLTPKKIDDLVAKGVVSGGMLPKIGSALDAARSGVKSVHIIDGRVPHALLLEVLTDQGVGTLIRSK